MCSRVKEWKKRTVGIGEEGSHTGQCIDLDSVLGLGKTKQEQTGAKGEEGHCEFSTTSGNFDHCRGKERSRDTTSGLVDISTVSSVDRVVARSDFTQLCFEVGTEESVEQGVGETQHSVNDGNQRSGECESGSREQCLDVTGGGVGHGEFDEVHGGHVGRLTLLHVGDFLVVHVWHGGVLKVFDSECRSGLVSLGDLVNDLNGCLVSTNGSEELGRLVDGADKESTDPKGTADASAGISVLFMTITHIKAPRVK